MGGLLPKVGIDYFKEIEDAGDEILQKMQAAVDHHDDPDKTSEIPVKNAQDWNELVQENLAKAQEAAKDAAVWQRKTEHMDLIATAAKEQAKAAKLEETFVKKDITIDDPLIATVGRFCNQVGRWVLKHPERSKELAWLKLRRFCAASAENFKDIQLAHRPVRVAIFQNHHAYDRPPKKLPHQPLWPPWPPWPLDATPLAASNGLAFQHPPPAPFLMEVTSTPQKPSIPQQVPPQVNGQTQQFNPDLKDEDGNIMHKASQPWDVKDGTTTAEGQPSPAVGSQGTVGTSEKSRISQDTGKVDISGDGIVGTSVNNNVGGGQPSENTDGLKENGTSKDVGNADDHGDGPSENIVRARGGNVASMMEFI